MSIAFGQQAWQFSSTRQRFLDEMPRIERVLRFQFRRWPRRRRHEAVADALAACWHAWYGLVRRGRDPVAVGVTGLAFNASRYVRNGRQFGLGTAGRGAADVYRRRVQARYGFVLLRLDRLGCDRRGRERETWREVLAADPRTSPADAAAFRIDLRDWLGRMPERRRWVAERLAEGHGTGELARRLGVTPAVISQTRRWLERDWADFQGDVGVPTVRPVGPASQAGPCGRESTRRATERRQPRRAHRPARQ
jgi:transposase-like protein